MATNVTKLAKFVDDETKKTIQHIYATPNFETKRNYRCMWCTLDVENEPIGCPIDTIEIFQGTKNAEQKPSSSFATFGIFCSFNCARAYSDDRCHDPKFKNSARLLALMYSYMRGTITPITITPAPPMTMLSVYGGDMSESQYRESFGRLIYANKGVLKMFPVTLVFEESENL